MTDKKVCAYTLGCKVNQYDTTAMLELLQADGFTVVPWGESADVCLINTCTVTNTADKKSRNMIRRAVRQSGDPVVCVCGCLAQKEAEELLEVPGVSAVVGTADRRNIVAVVRGCLAGKQKVGAVRDVERETTYEKISVCTSGELTRGYIKIQEGCNQFCSYCVIPYVRGRVRSRRADDIIEEARALAKNEVREIVLTGIHISSFGQDTGEALSALLRRLDRTEGLLRIRLGSLEPQILTTTFLRELEGLQKLCPHFHVSLQSGSTPVLKRMNRKYTAEEYAKAVGLLRQFYGNPAISTDLITGFPGESAEEFAKTAAFVRTIGFSRIHVFPYSERAGTAAARMEGSVPVHVRKKRAQELIALGEELERQYAAQFLGTEQEVLFEQAMPDGRMEGYTDRYLRVAARGVRTGEAAKVLLLRQNDGIIDGETYGTEGVLK